MILCANPAAQFLSYKSEIEAAILRVARSNRYILGEEVILLEKEFSEYIGVSDSIGVANGTDAIELAIKSLDIKPGDEIITVSHTAVATVAAIEAVGATPVLIDVDPIFYTINLEQLSKVFTKKTRAIIAVHLYGHPADLDTLANFCKNNNLYLIEDVSQAHGAKWKGKRLGSFGHIGCFSCYPTKNLGAIGDAGLIVTKDRLLSEKIRMLREYGWKNRYVSEIKGRNSRLDEIQAAILRIKLRYLDLDNIKRRERAAYYSKNLNKNIVALPEIRKDSEPVFHLYVVRTKKQRDLILHLKSLNIQSLIHYPVPIHLQPAYKDTIKTSKDMKITERISQEVVSLPMYPELPFSDIDKVIDAINSFQ
jgi:dTDP-4-amino-4,6-dideoxygalactose transaminase